MSKTPRVLRYSIIQASSICFLIAENVTQFHENPKRPNTTINTFFFCINTNIHSGDRALHLKRRYSESRQLENIGECGDDSYPIVIPKELAIFTRKPLFHGISYSEKCKHSKMQSEDASRSSLFT